MGQATTWTGVFFYHCSDELMYSRASALLLLLLKLVVSVLEMASNKRKAKKMLKFKENDIAANYCTQIKNTKLKFLCTLTVFVEF